MSPLRLRSMLKAVGRKQVLYFQLLLENTCTEHLYSTGENSCTEHLYSTGENTCTEHLYSTGENTCREHLYSTGFNRSSPENRDISQTLNTLRVLA